MPEISAEIQPDQPVNAISPALKNRGRALVLIGAIMWSTSGVFARAPVFADWGLDIQGPILAFWRTFFGAMILLPVVRTPQWNVLLVPLGVAFALMNLTYLTAMVRTTPANAVWLQNSAPFWVLLIAVVILHERPKRLDLVAITLGLTGVGIILGFELSRSTNCDPLGLFCGFASGITYAAILTLLNRLGNLNSAWLCITMQLSASLCLLPWLIWIGVWPNFWQFVVLAAFGAVQLGIPYLLVTRGLRYISPTEGVAIGLIEPIVMPIWVFLAWGIGVPWWTVVGAAFILAGLVLRYFVLPEREEAV